MFSTVGLARISSREHAQKLLLRLRGTHTGSFMGIPASGQPVVAGGMAIERLADGRLAESWMYLDAPQLLRQLGVAPVLEHGPGQTAAHPPGGNDRRTPAIELETGNES